MTKEQIEKRMGEIGWIMSFTGVYHAKTSTVIELIQTIAIEAQREGRKEIIKIVEKLIKEQKP